MRSSNHLILCITFSSCPQSFPASGSYSFKWVSSLHQVAKYWSFSFSISPSYEYSGLIIFRMDWLDLLAIQGTLKSFLQHHSSKASILWCSVFFTVQLSHPYMTTRKTVVLTRQTFVDKVVSLLFNILSKLVITFLPRSKRLLISWLQSPSAGIFGAPPQNQPLFPHLFSKKWWDRIRDLVFWMLSFKPIFHTPLSLKSIGSLVLIHFLPEGWCHLHI